MWRYLLTIPQQLCYLTSILCIYTSINFMSWTEFFFLFIKKFSQPILNFSSLNIKQESLLQIHSSCKFAVFKLPLLNYLTRWRLSKSKQNLIFLFRLSRETKDSLKATRTRKKKLRRCRKAGGKSLPVILFTKKIQQKKIHSHQKKT